MMEKNSVLWNGSYDTVSSEIWADGFRRQKCNMRRLQLSWSNELMLEITSAICWL